MTEKLFELEVNKLKIFGMIHYAENKNSPGAILFHGFTGNSIEPHRFFVKLARRLAKEGISTLRFDFRGAGQSQGESEDMNFYDWVDDGKTVYDYFKEDNYINNKKMYVIGLSMGGAILLYLLYKKLISPQKVVFLSSAITLPQLAKFLKETEPKYNEKYIDKTGNKISIEALDIAEKINFFDYKYENLPEALIIHSKNDVTVPYEASLRLKEIYEKNNGKSNLVLLESGGHTYNSIESETTVIQEIIKFLKD